MGSANTCACTLVDELMERYNLPKALEFRTTILSNLDLGRWQQFLCVSPEGFNYILSRIENHVIFLNNSNGAQSAPSLQLVVTLHRLGSESSCSSTSINTGQIFEIGEGTAVSTFLKIYKSNLT